MDLLRDPLLESISLSVLPYDKGSLRRRIRRWSCICLRRRQSRDDCIEGLSYWDKLPSKQDCALVGNGREKRKLGCYGGVDRPPRGSSYCCLCCGRSSRVPDDSYGGWRCFCPGFQVFGESRSCEQIFGFSMFSVASMGMRTKLRSSTLRELLWPWL